jgi:hypothetical protein
MMSDALIFSALRIPSNVSGNPVPHALVLDVSEFCHFLLVVIKVVIELIGVGFNQLYGSGLDE